MVAATEELHEEEKDPEYQHLDLMGTLHFSDTTEVFCREFLHRSENGEVSSSPDELDDKALARRLSQVKSTTGGLRLFYGNNVWVKKKGYVMPVSQTSWNKIMEELGVPANFKQVMEEKGARAWKRTSRYNGDRRTCYTFKFGIPPYSYFMLTLSHSQRSNITTAFLLMKTNSNSRHLFLDLISRLESSSYSDVSHPLHLAAFIADITISSCGVRVQECDITLHKMEEELGQHEYKNIQPNNDPLNVDLMLATRRLNFLARKTAAEVLRLESTLETVEQIKDWAKEIKGRKSSKHRLKVEDNHVVHDDGDTERDDDDDDDDAGLAEMLPWLRYSCKINLHRAEFMKTRKDSLIQVVYNFMAQKNAEVNIAIARASTTIADENRRDAASMKTIAILGMIFLPGTYLATVFAMPVFDWDAAGNGPVTKKGFALYWAVTIPVTLAVLIVWGLARGLPWRIWAETVRLRRERRFLWLRRALGEVEMGELHTP